MKGVHAHFEAVPSVVGRRGGGLQYSVLKVEVRWFLGPAASVGALQAHTSTNVIQNFREMGYLPREGTAAELFLVSPMKYEATVDAFRQGLARVKKGVHLLLGHKSFKHWLYTTIPEGYIENPELPLKPY